MRKACPGRILSGRRKHLQVSELARTQPLGFHPVIRLDAERACSQ
jgi:hypothetical protein